MLRMLKFRAETKFCAQIVALTKFSPKIFVCTYKFSPKKNFKIFFRPKNLKNILRRT